MPAFSNLERAGFDGIDFPIQSCTVRNSLRRHIHIWRRVPGGGLEKFGRGVYEIEMDALFHKTAKGYGDLWPTALAAMRSKFEKEVSSELVIPTIGRIRACIDEWEQRADFKVLSGEFVRLKFIEDQDEEALTTSLVDVSSRTLSTSVDKFKFKADAISPKPSIFESILNSANSVLAIKDQFDLFGSLIASKIEGLAALIDQADRQVVELQDPTNHEILDALHELWASTLQLGRDFTEGSQKPHFYIVPAQMTVGQISAALYDGDNSRSSEIMQNNDLEDPWSVRAGTEVIYFKDS